MYPHGRDTLVLDEDGVIPQRRLSGAYARKVFQTIDEVDTEIVAPILYATPAWLETPLDMLLAPVTRPDGRISMSNAEFMELAMERGGMSAHTFWRRLWEVGSYSAAVGVHRGKAWFRPLPPDGFRRFSRTPDAAETLPWRSESTSPHDGWYGRPKGILPYHLTHFTQAFTAARQGRECWYGNIRLANPELVLRSIGSRPLQIALAIFFSHTVGDARQAHGMQNLLLLSEKKMAPLSVRFLAIGCSREQIERYTDTVRTRIAAKFGSETFRLAESMDSFRLRANEKVTLSQIRSTDTGLRTGSTLTACVRVHGNSTVEDLGRRLFAAEVQDRMGQI